LHPLSVLGILKRMNDELSHETELVANWLQSGSINIFGRQFSGKDTQGRILADTFDGFLLGGGDIMRNSVIPPHVADDMKKGNLVPRSDYIKIVTPYLSRQEFAGHPLFLSSVGRWIGEEEGVISAAKASGHPIKAVVYLDMPKELSYQRWEMFKAHDNRGVRDDESFESFGTRLREFENKTLPLMEVYDKLGLLISVDANQSVEAVTKAILKQLANRALTSQ
jgi:adenylate kinase